MTSTHSHPRRLAPPAGRATAASSLTLVPDRLEFRWPIHALLYCALVQNESVTGQKTVGGDAKQLQVTGHGLSGTLFAPIYDGPSQRKVTKHASVHLSL